MNRLRAEKANKANSITRWYGVKECTAPQAVLYSYTTTLWHSMHATNWRQQVSIVSHRYNTPGIMCTDLAYPRSRRSHGARCTDRMCI